jgi:adenylate cyclase
MLTEGEKRAIERSPTENMQAYEYYLRGRQFMHQFRRSGYEHALRMFERAIEIDPRYGPAYAGASDCCCYLYTHWDRSQAKLDKADAASRKALEVAPEQAEAHASRGFALSLLKRFDEAEREFETAIRLNPRLYEAHYLYARACFQEGKLEDAVRHYAEAARVRPDDYQALALMTNPLKSLGRRDEAETAFRRSLALVEKHLELNPDDARALYLGASALIQSGDRARGLEWNRRALAIDPEDSGLLYNVACVFALLGQKEDAIDTISKSVANGMHHWEWLEQDSDLDSLRGDSRFDALITGLKGQSSEPQ